MSDEAVDSDEQAMPPTWLDRVIRRYKRLLFFGGLTWVGLLLAGGIVLSSVEARNGLNIFGQKEWLAGQHTAFRVSLEDLQFGTRRPLSKVKVRLSNVNIPYSDATFVLTERVGDYVQGTIPVPKEPGKWQVEFETEDVDTPLFARTEVSVVKGEETVLEHPLTLFKKGERQEGPRLLNLRPLHGELPSELESKVVVYSSIEGTDLAEPIDLDVREGASKKPLPTQVRVKENGLRVLDIQSVRPAWAIELSTVSSRVETALYPKPHQFGIELPSLTDQTEIEVSVTSIAKTGPIFFDIWFNGYWLLTQAGVLEDGAYAGRLRLPPSLPQGQPVWLQVYNNTYQPGNNRAGRHIIIGDKQDHRVLETLVAMFRVERPATRHFLKNLVGDIENAAFLLGLIKWPIHDPPLLANSGLTVRQTVSTVKGMWQRRLAFAFIATAIALLLGILFLLRQNQRDVTHAWNQLSDSAGIEVGTRRRAWLDAVLLIVVVILFLGGLLAIVNFVRW